MRLFSSARPPPETRYFVYMRALIFPGAFEIQKKQQLFVYGNSEKPAGFQRVSFVMFTFLMCEHLEKQSNKLEISILKRCGAFS